MADKPHAGRIENWKIYSDKDRDWIEGNVYGHPGFGEGEYFYTSSLVRYSPSNSEIETLNSRYTLGVKRG
jgi:hypothetical protein